MPSYSQDILFTIVPVADEPTLNEMAEYFLDASREDTSPSGHRLPMLIVYHTGDQLNLYRVIDRDVASSLSYSIGQVSKLNCVTSLFLNIGYYALYVVGHPKAPWACSLRVRQKLTFLCWRAI